MRFRPIVDMPVAGQVYAEGWQSWSPVRIYRAGEVSERAPDERAQTTEWRPKKPVQEGVIQAEGLLAVAPPDGPARAWFAPSPAGEIATLRLAVDRDRLVLSADGPVEEVQAGHVCGACRGRRPAWRGQGGADSSWLVLVVLLLQVRHRGRRDREPRGRAPVVAADRDRPARRRL